METTIKKKPKSFTYHTYHSYTDVETGQNTNFMTQLYKIGIYGILNGDSAMQTTLDPSDMVRIEKSLKKMEQDGKIKNLQFNRPITVSDTTGFWEEVKS
jgi:hypothetical protein